MPNVFYRLPPSWMQGAISLRRKAVESYDTLRSSMAFFYFILVEIYFRHLVKTIFWNVRAGKFTARASRARCGVPDSSIPNQSTYDGPYARHPSCRGSSKRSVTQSSTLVTHLPCQNAQQSRWTRAVEKKKKNEKQFCLRVCRSVPPPVCLRVCVPNENFRRYFFNA